MLVSMYMCVCVSDAKWFHTAAADSILHRVEIFNFSLGMVRERAVNQYLNCQFLLKNIPGLNLKFLLSSIYSEGICDSDFSLEWES